jgi:hypothetical protein
MHPHRPSGGDGANFSLSTPARSPIQANSGGEKYSKRQPKRINVPDWNGWWLCAIYAQ